MVVMVFNVAGISGRNLGDGPLHECPVGWEAAKNNLTAQFLMLIMY
jgi:hypothetical protein